MTDLELLESAAHELITLFEIKAPPVPVETMLSKPIDGLWREVDLTQLSGTFLSIRDPYSPRMSFTRMLARHVGGSDWGKERGVFKVLTQGEDFIQAFGRMLIMPAEMINALSAGARTPTAVSMQFEVPEDDARQRLEEIFGKR
jgi:hypothetical protein